MEELLLSVSHALKKAALDQQAKNYILADQVLYSRLKKAADRYIGGETLKEALPKVMLHNEKGYKCSLEYMGENSRSVAEANAATAEFVRIAATINRDKLQSTISLDLSHIGLGISNALALENLDTICRTAGNAVEVTISAESHTQTEQVLSVYRNAAALHPNVAITLQAYLYRTAEDFEAIRELPGRIRIVKGAFDTPLQYAMPRSAKLDDAYLSYIEALLAAGHKCAIATHDDLIQKECRSLIDSYKPAWDTYEFESLYGIQGQRIEELRQQGYNAKMYFVYGREWYLYLCNRIAENPVSLLQAFIDITDK